MNNKYYGKHKFEVGMTLYEIEFYGETDIHVVEVIVQSSKIINDRITYYYAKANDLSRSTELFPNTVNYYIFFTKERAEKHRQYLLKYRAAQDARYTKRYNRICVNLAQNQKDAKELANKYIGKRIFVKTQCPSDTTKEWYITIIRYLRGGHAKAGIYLYVDDNHNGYLLKNKDKTWQLLTDEENAAEDKRIKDEHDAYIKQQEAATKASAIEDKGKQIASLFVDLNSAIKVRDEYFEKIKLIEEKINKLQIEAKELEK